MKTNIKLTPVSAASQPPKWKLRAAIGLALGVGLASQGVNAATPITYTWDGSDSSKWSDMVNWGTSTGDMSASQSSNLFVLTDGSKKSATNNDISSLVLGELQFKSGMKATTVSGNSFSVSGIGSTGSKLGIVNNDDSTQTINLSGTNSITLAADQIWQAASSGALNIGSASPTNKVINGGNTLTLDNADTGAINIFSAISGTGGLTKTGTGSGVTTLSGTNTYTGATRISDGTLQVGAGGTTGTISSSSAITNNATLAFNRSNALTVSNDITGTGSLDKWGAGTLTLSGNNSYAGATNINAGTLALGASNVLANSGTVNVAGGTFNVNGKTETIANLNLNSGAINGGGTLTVAMDYTNAGFGSGNAFNKSAGVTTTVINSSASSVDKQQRLSIDGGTATYVNTAMDFGAKHVGDAAVTKTYNIKNAANSGSTLRGAVQNDGAVNSNLSGSGIEAAGSDWTAAKNTSVGAKNVIFTATTAGALNETLTVVNNFNNTNTQTLAITGSVYDYAKVGFQNTGGAGTWDGTGLTLDFGTFAQGSGDQTATFSLANIGGLDALYTDLLDGNYTFNLGSAFSSSNVSNFTNLAGGSSLTNLDFLFNTSAVGDYTGSLFLASTGHNISGYSGALDGMTINFKGSVVSAVPVPAAAWLFLTGMVGLLGFGRRNKAV